jgi:hypothetical protein
MQLDIFHTSGLEITELKHKLIDHFSIKDSVTIIQQIGYGETSDGKMVQFQILATVNSDDFLPDGYPLVIRINQKHHATNSNLG